MKSILTKPFKKRKRKEERPEFYSRLEKYNTLSTEQFSSQFLSNEGSLTFKPEANHPFEIELVFQNVEDLPKQDLERCVALLRATSKKHYKNSSRGWNEADKRDEMKEDHMRYIIAQKRPPGSGSENAPPQLTPEDDVVTVYPEFTADDDPAIRDFGFISFKLDDDEDEQGGFQPVLFIYEIHLGTGMRSLGLGKHLIKVMEQISRQAEMDKVMLSVFTVNEGADRLYRRLGFVTDGSSPHPKVTRKKVIPPEWLYLCLPTNNSGH